MFYRPVEEQHTDDIIAAESGMISNALSREVVHIIACCDCVCSLGEDGAALKEAVL